MKKSYTLLSFGILLIMLLAGSAVKAATRTSTTTGGNWSATTTWIGGVVPLPGDDAIINNGATVTVTANATCNSLASLAGATGTVTVNSGIILTVTTSVSIPGSTGNGTLVIAGTGTLDCVSINICDNTTPGASGNSVFTLISLITNLNVSGSVTLTSAFKSGGSKTNNPVLNLQSGTLTIGGSIVTTPGSGGNAGTAANTFLIENTQAPHTGTLKINGTPAWNLTATGTNTIALNGVGTDVQYNGAGAQTVYPTSYDNLTIANSGIATLNGTITVAGLLHAMSGSQTSVTANGLTTANMTLEDDAELVVSNAVTMTVTNPATIKRNMGSLGAWHYFCYPITVSNTKFFLTSPSSNYVKWYDEVLNVWHYLGTTQADSGYSNKPAYGYAVWATTSTSYTFTGTVNDGTISTTVTRSTPTNLLGDQNGWNLVGNPYPCSLDLATATGTWTNLDPWAYFWHPGESSGSSGYIGGNYDVYGGGLVPNGGSTHTQYAPALQGFFVKVNPSFTSGTYVVSNANRAFSSETWMKSTESGAYFIKFEVLSSVNGSTDRASVYFNSQTSTGYNENEDAQKLTGSAGAPQLFTTADSTKLTIQGLPITGESQVVPMGFDCTLAGSYMLTASDIASFNEGVNITLVDLKTNAGQDLRTNPVYSFDYETSDSPDRFLLVLSNLYTGVEKKNADTHSVQIYSYNSTVYIRSTDGKNLSGDAFIYDLMGREFYHGQLVQNTLNNISPVISEGYYVVKVVTADGVYTQKIYLK